MFYVEDNFSFFHIPKCGGSTFTDLILSKYGEKFREPSSQMWMGNDHVHRPIKWWMDNLVIDPNLPIYSMCRNPYTRMASWFTFIKFHPELQDRRKNNPQAIEFVEQLSFEQMLLNDFPSDNPIEKVKNYNHRSSMIHFFQDFDIEKVNFLKLEDRDTINKRFSIDMDSDIKRKSPTDLDFIKNIYTDTCIDIVRTNYSDDFEYFGYSKDFQL